MCFKPPKPPKVSDPVADPSLTRQRVQAEQDYADQKAADKQTRTEQQLAILAGRLGRKSLFSGGQGGGGFGRYSLFEGAPMNPAQPAQPVQPVQPSSSDFSPGGGGGIRNFVGGGYEPFMDRRSLFIGDRMDQR